jgi:hypothetical protein
MLKWLWPEIIDLDTAKKAARNGAAAAFFIAAVTGIVTYLETSGKMKLFGLGPEAYIDSGLFLIIGVGILFYSRIAAIAGLGLYCFEQYTMLQSSQPRFSIMMLFMVLAFITGIRGCFEYHSLKKQEKESADQPASGPVSILTGQPVTPLSPENFAASEPKKFNFRKFCLIGSAVMFGIAALIFGVSFFYFKQQGKSKTVSTESLPPTANTNPAAIPAIAAGSSVQTGNLAGTRHTFHMKSGETVSGNVMMEDSDLVVVKAGAKEEVLSRADIASIE